MILGVKNPIIILNVCIISGSMTPYRQRYGVHTSFLKPYAFQATPIVLYIISGSMSHKDSAGNSGDLLPGWVQWMTAGSGVVHSEMPSEELLKNGGRLEGFQLWVNLPKKDKMIRPRYQDTAAEKIPVVKSNDGKTTVKVIAGESLGTKAVIETRSPILYLDIHVSPDGSFTQKIPSDFNCFVYTWRGSGFIGETAVKMGQVALLSKNGEQVTIKGGEKETIHVLLIGGIPLNEPIAHRGPFVMNTWEEIDQAIRDYHSGKLGKIAGEEERYEKTRSAVQQQKNTGTWRDSL
ncbi:Hypothetical predicted protein [Paramuricea clavata]|uniref:Uncharacterized protein n=1 Tax=Paramuricea clavata TaxID=317549 RepID=A0A7D9D5A9_PARCT|nr:Hypothetical predicted protein [Paramuricea clavata]